MVQQSPNVVSRDVIIDAYPAQLLCPLTLLLVMGERMAAAALDRLLYKAAAGETSPVTKVQ